MKLLFFIEIHQCSPTLGANCRDRKDLNSTIDQKRKIYLNSSIKSIELDVGRQLLKFESIKKNLKLKLKWISESSKKAHVGVF